MKYSKKFKIAFQADDEEGIKLLLKKVEIESEKVMMTFSYMIKTFIISLWTNKIRRAMVICYLFLWILTGAFMPRAIGNKVVQKYPRYPYPRVFCIPIAPGVAYCNWNNMVSLGGHGETGLYFWYGFGVVSCPFTISIA